MNSFFALVLASITLITCHAQKTDLALKLEKGNEYKQNTSSKATITQDINGQKMDMVMTMEATVTFLVNSVHENGYDMDAKFERLRMSIQLPQGLMEFNSEKNDPNDIFSIILGAMKNKPFNVLMSKNGKITDVKNVEALWETAINQFDQVPEMQKEQVRTQLMRAYGEKALKGNIEMVTAIYPDNSVRKGDKWTIKTNLESGMSAKMTSDYVFAELTSDYAIITGNSSIETADKDSYIESNGMPMKYDLKGTMVSKIKVDKKSGWIIEAKINQEVSGGAYIKENPQLPNGMKIPMTIKSEMVITD